MIQINPEAIIAGLESLPKNVDSVVVMDLLVNDDGVPDGKNPEDVAERLVAIREKLDLL